MGPNSMSPKLVNIAFIRQELSKLDNRKSVIIVCAFFSGNLTSNEAEGLVEQIENTLAAGPLVKAKPPFQSQHTEQRIVKLGPGADWYFPIAGTNSQDDNSALQTYFQVFIVMPGYTAV